MNQLCCVFSIFLTVATFASSQPNVLLIITDDQGYGDLSIHGNPILKTPNIDSIGRHGVRFDRFYVSTVCAPSRAAILSGMDPVRSGVHGVTRNQEAMDPDVVTIAEALKAANYHTGYFGKWHNGAQYPYVPTGQGFDDFFGFTAGHVNNYFDTTLLRGLKPEETTGYIADVITDEAIRFIKENQSETLFCYLSFNTPHSPYQVPDEYFDRFFGREGLDEREASFLGMCENIDDNIGRVIKVLKETGLYKDTIVLFLTDNGTAAGDKLFDAGMRGKKTHVHEGGSRVPLFIDWPRAGWTPHVVNNLTAHIDLYPTLLDLCGVQSHAGSQLEGTSLRPLLENRTADFPDRTLFTHNTIDQTNRYPGAVRTSRYRLVRKIPGPQAGSASVNRDTEALPWELYDMIADSAEKNDLASSQPKVVDTLSRQYEEFVDDIFSDSLSRFPLPVGYNEHNPVSLHASQAYFRDPVHYQSGRGFAHDWLTGWTSTAGKVWFEINVVQAGIYMVSIQLGCPGVDAGSRIRVTANRNSCEASVPSAPSQEIQLPHREERSRSTFRERDWTTLEVGRIELREGKQDLTIEALSMPGKQVMDFKLLMLERK